MQKIKYPPWVISELKKLIQEFQDFTPGIFKFSGQTRFIFEIAVKFWVCHGGAGQFRNEFEKLRERSKGAPYGFKSWLFRAGAIVGKGANLKPLKMRLNGLNYTIVSGGLYCLK